MSPQSYICCTLLSNTRKQSVAPNCLPYKQVFISLKLTLNLITTTFLPNQNSCAINLAAASSLDLVTDLSFSFVCYQWFFGCFPHVSSSFLLVLPRDFLFYFISIIMWHPLHVYIPVDDAIKCLPLHSSCILFTYFHTFQIW